MTVRRIIREGPPRREAPPIDSEESTEGQGQDHTNIATTYTDRSLCIVPPRRTQVDLAAAAADSEIALLSSLMFRPEVIAEVAKLVSVADFLFRDHQDVYRGLLELDGTVDLTSLCDVLRRGGSELAEDRGRLYTIVCSDHVSSWCFERHATALIDHARRRRAVEIFAAGQDDARDMTRPIERSIELVMEALQGGGR